MLRLALATLLTIGALAGCLTGSGPTSPSTSAPMPTTPTTNPPARFDGNAAFSLVAGLVQHPDGSVRYRIPGTASHDEAGVWLWHHMQQPGWQVHWQNFTGHDYEAVPKGGVATYATSDCSGADHQAMLGMTFQNLWAVLPAGSPTNRTLLLAAHWDSQPRSDADPDRQKRPLPDPAANDGGSGVGVLLELMREVHAGMPLADALPFNIGVFLTDGEDGYYACYPDAGSLIFVHDATTRHVASRFLLLDMVGDPGARFIRESSSLASDRAMVDVLWTHGTAIAGAVHFTQQQSGIADDHLPFIEAGIPSVDLIDAGWPTNTGFPPQWDTTNDTLDRLSPQMLGWVGQTLLDAFSDPALAGPWP